MRSRDGGPSHPGRQWSWGPRGNPQGHVALVASGHKPHTLPASRAARGPSAAGAPGSPDHSRGGPDHPESQSPAGPGSRSQAAVLGAGGRRQDRFCPCMGLGAFPSFTEQGLIHHVQEIKAKRNPFQRQERECSEERPKP